MSTFTLPVTPVVEIINFLKQNLKLPTGAPYGLHVTDWMPTSSLLDTFLSNDVVPFVVTVRSLNGETGRQVKERTFKDLEHFEICVYTLEAPEYQFDNFTPVKIRLRDFLVNEIKSLLKQEPFFVTVDYYKNLDKLIAKVLLIQTAITVSILHES
ncbi:MAG: hypothetical protein FWF27_04625 [Candidatus Bathyarchaeota archaeon]|nr:hypothetical protein [Candidatus Termiticorpusculum sp.]